VIRTIGDGISRLGGELGRLTTQDGTNIPLKLYLTTSELWFG